MLSTGWVCREGAQAGGDVEGPGGPGGRGRRAPPAKCWECPGPPAKGAAPTPGTANSVCGGIPAERPRHAQHPERLGSHSVLSLCMLLTAGVNGRVRPQALRVLGVPGTLEAT